MLCLLNGVKALNECEGVGIAPRKMVLTRSHETKALLQNLKRKKGAESSYIDDIIDSGMIDVHTFNHFYTFQVDRDVDERNEGVVIDITYEDEANAASDMGYAMRLRAEFNSQEASRSQMGFKATFGYKQYDKSGYFFKKLAEVSSQNS